MQKKQLDEQAVCAGYLAGKSIRDLAAELGVSVAPIQRILRDNRITARRGRGPDKAPRLARSTARSLGSFSQKDRAEIKRRFLEENETQLALAKAFDCGATTIGRILRAEGVPAGAHGQLREHHHAFKGGKTLNGDGYVLVLADPDDEIAQAMCTKKGYVLEHRLVMAHALGRPLAEYETVHHHDDGDKTDNRLEKLQLRIGQHGKGAAFRCRACGSNDIEPVDLA